VRRRVAAPVRKPAAPVKNAATEAEIATKPAESGYTKATRGCWGARAAWLTKPDRPACVPESTGRPLFHAGRAVGGEFEAVARKIKLAIRDATRDAKPVALKAGWLAPLEFFSADFEVFMVHACGKSRDGQNWDAYFYAYRRHRRSRGRPDEETWEVESYNLKSAPLYTLNDKAELIIDGHHLAYLRYFMHIVRGEQGPFRLVDRPERDRDWPFSPEALIERLGASGPGQAKPEELIELRTRLHQPRFDGVDGEGRLRYRACVIYGGELFHTDLALQQAGIIEMLDDDPIRTVQELRE
jgi:hypothetical protein